MRMGQYNGNVIVLNTANKHWQAKDDDVSVVELKGFSRSVAELEWLLLILVILYLVTPGTHVVNDWVIVKSSVCYGMFVLAFRYLNFYRRETRFKLGVEIWAMVIFISVILWYTGKIHSPLLNLYLLVIITSGLTMGKFSTTLILGVITCIYLYMGMPGYLTGNFTAEQFGLIMTVFAPYILIAYLTTMLSADLHFAKRMFKQLSETDELTGLENLRSFKNTLSMEIQKASRYKHVFSVLMIDADGLKKVNDMHGHEAGNTLIKTVAGSIKTCLRESDSLARYGGDEFVILLPETEREAALEAGERIRKAVEHTAVDLDGKQLKTTVSIGIASYPAHAASLDELIQRADAALYSSKAGGRNMVSVHASA